MNVDVAVAAMLIGLHADADAELVSCELFVELDQPLPQPQGFSQTMDSK
jgi:hypothetical protein